jgi:hypothetical protein
MSQTCWKLPFIDCELSGACQRDGRLQMISDMSNGEATGCSIDFLDEIPEDKIELVRADCTKEGYLSPTIEQVLLDLNDPSRDFDVLLSGGHHEVTSFAKFRERHGLVLPFPINAVTKNVNYNERFSSLGREVKNKSGGKDRCRDIVRIIAKLDENYMTQFDGDTTLSTVGTLEHLIGQGEPKKHRGLNLAHPHSLRKLGIEPVPRSSYCEIPVEYEHQGVVVKGTADAVCKMGDYLVIIDRKRALVPSGLPPKGEHERQLGGYALAVEQMTGRKFDGYLLIKAGRPFPPANIDPSVVGKQRKLSCNITFMEKDGEMVRKIQEEEIVQGTHDQKYILSNPKKWTESKSLYEAKGVCERCWEKAACDDLTKRVVNGQRPPLKLEVML